jgi:hypothetical protein
MLNLVKKRWNGAVSQRPATIEAATPKATEVTPWGSNQPINAMAVTRLDITAQNKMSDMGLWAFMY